MLIRQIGPDEAALLLPLNAVVQRLHAAHRPDIFPPEPDAAAVAAHFVETLARPGWFALLAEADGAAIGYALCEVQRIEAHALHHARTRGFLHHVAVAETARRRGVASALLEAAKARFQAEGATVWATTYWAWNDASAALMAKAGLWPAIILADAPLG
ncbi:MAG: GNAT family N-acetyltransferase [Rhodobacteraceae bacterium]|nr:GNAT family N-acetyltransferase [Paracoccaceae bacterium]